jgi:hypothetical protein
MVSPTRSAWILTALLCAGLLLLPGCGQKTPLPADQQVYAGRWVAPDGTYVRIYLDGSGKVETSNTSISGGQVTIQGNSLTVSLFGITKKYRIDQPPREENGAWTMVLDGITHTKKDDPFE